MKSDFHGHQKMDLKDFNFFIVSAKAPIFI